MLSTPGLKALLAILLLCGGHSLTLASPMYSNFHEPSELISHAFEAGWQDHDHDEPPPRFNIESEYERIHRGSGFGYHSPRRGSADDVSSSFQKLDPYNHQPTPDRSLGRQHHAPALSPPPQELEPYHGSGDGRSTSLEGLDPYVVDILTPGRTPTSSGSASMDHSSALPPPWHSSTPSYFDEAGTMEWAPHPFGLSGPAGNSQARRLDRGASWSRNQPVHRESPRTHREKQTADQRNTGGMPGKYRVLAQVNEPNSEAAFELVQTNRQRPKPRAKDSYSLIFEEATQAQRDRIMRRLRHQITPGIKIEWVANNNGAAWGMRPAEKRWRMTRTIRSLTSFKNVGAFMPYFLNNHLVYFADVPGKRDQMDVFAFPYDREAHDLDTTMHKVTHVGTLSASVDAANAM